MQFTKAALTSILSLGSLVSTSAILPRSDTLQKRDNGASCNFQYTVVQNLLQVQVTTWGYWADDWGNTFLQNLYNQCGNVNNWAFWYDNGDNSQTGHASFSINQYSTVCVNNAIWLASDQSGSGAIWGVQCQDTSQCATC